MNLDLKTPVVIFSYYVKWDSLNNFEWDSLTPSSYGSIMCGKLPLLTSHIQPLTSIGVVRVDLVRSHYV